MATNPLVGKTVVEVQLTSDNKAIRFVLSDGSDVVARADGDCCSSTWIEHVSLPPAGFPALVLGAKGIPMPDLGSPGDGVEIAYYGFAVSTDRGELLIDFRNESNGYYGGSLVWPGEYFYGGVSGQNEANGTWVTLAEDK